MNVGQPQATRSTNKICMLLMDANAERRALRTKILALHGIEVVGATDLTEASSIWHRDRYDLILIDIRTDHRSCIAWRDEIKKEKPKQIIAFLVGKPNYVDLDPIVGSYVAEEHGTEWGDSLRAAIRKSCASLPQRNSFVEVGWRISAARKLNGASCQTSQLEGPTKDSQEFVGDADDDHVDVARPVAESERES
jgi:CheY-like chemotaxis protein